MVNKKPIKDRVKKERKRKCNDVKTETIYETKGGNRTDDYGPFVPYLLKNESDADRRKYFEIAKARKEQTYKDYQNKLNEWQKDSSELMKKREQDMKDEQFKTEQNQIYHDRTRKLVHDTHQKGMTRLSGFIYTICWSIIMFLYFIYYNVIQFIYTVIFYVTYPIISFFKWLIFDRSFEVIKNSFVYIYENIRGFVKSFFKYTAAFWRGLIHYGSLFGYWIITAFGWSFNEFISKLGSFFKNLATLILKAANNRIVLVLVKYLLLILFILWILGSLFNISLKFPIIPGIPNMPGLDKINPFNYVSWNSFGYSMLKDRFDYLIGNPFRKSFGIDELGTGYDPSIGGGGITDILSYNPSTISMPEFSKSAKDEPLTLSNIPTKCMDYIAPGGSSWFNGFNISYNQLKSTYNYIVHGKAMDLSNSKPRESLENIGRCDNVYNYDIDKCFKKRNSSEFDNDTMINYDNNVPLNKRVSIDLSEPASLKNHSISIGKPTDIEMELNPEKYFDLDYNKLPDSIKNLKDKDGLSLKDKTKITIPWVEQNGLYILSFNNAYYTKDKTKKPIDPPILIDKEKSFDRCKKNSIIPTPYDENLYVTNVFD